MRTHATYEVECECGRHISTREPVTRCQCGREIVIEWQAKPAEPRPEPKP